MSIGNTSRKLGRNKKQREALLASLAESLIESGQIRTTEGKAKALQPYIEKLITKANNSDDGQDIRRKLTSRLKGRDEAARRLVEEVAPQFTDRPGGYTRIVKLPPRESDGGYEAIIQFVGHDPTA